MKSIQMKIGDKWRQVQISDFSYQLLSASDLTPDLMRREIERSVVQAWNTLHYWPGEEFHHSFDEAVAAFCEKYEMLPPQVIREAIAFCAGMREAKEMSSE